MQWELQKVDLQWTRNARGPDVAQMLQKEWACNTPKHDAEQAETGGMMAEPLQ